ncbi:hypothetical protein ERJ75_001522900 [Trypanosoma vivax]|nr:hypothetical protein TRVL_03192 [Trypanosoma vivax]KAH8606224.1 hypothetical protein ERJ75_001522900 [Trypanosoma vivax]
MSATDTHIRRTAGLQEDFRHTDTDTSTMPPGRKDGRGGVAEHPKSKRIFGWRGHPHDAESLHCTGAASSTKENPSYGVPDSFIIRFIDSCIANNMPEAFIVEHVLFMVYAMQEQVLLAEALHAAQSEKKCPQPPPCSQTGDTVDGNGGKKASLAGDVLTSSSARAAAAAACNGTETQPNKHNRSKAGECALVDSLSIGKGNAGISSSTGPQRNACSSPVTRSRQNVSKALPRFAAASQLPRVMGRKVRPKSAQACSLLFKEDAYVPLVSAQPHGPRSATLLECARGSVSEWDSKIETASSVITPGVVCGEEGMRTVAPTPCADTKCNGCRATVTTGPMSVQAPVLFPNQQLQMYIERSERKIREVSRFLGNLRK